MRDPSLRLLACGFYEASGHYSKPLALVPEYFYPHVKDCFANKIAAHLNIFFKENKKI
jgi:hypothetical protein